MDEHEQREQNDVPEARALAVFLAKTRRGVRRVAVHAQTVCILQYTQRRRVSVQIIVFFFFWGDKRVRDDVIKSPCCARFCITTITG